MTESQPAAAAPPPAVAWTAPEPSAGPAPGIEWAGYGARLVAYILDSIIVTIGLTLVLIVFGGMLAFTGRPTSGSVGAVAGLSVLVFLAIIVLAIGYFPWFWARGGQTPGMRPLGIRVVRDSDGGRVGAAQAILRLVGMWVSAIVFYIGFIWIFIDKRRRAWHDLIGGTVVIKDPGR